MKIEFSMPGERRQGVLDLPESYRITVERNDGMAASEIEAWTAMTMLCSGMVPQKTKGKKGLSSDPVSS